jgi:hypothetical protein
MIRFKDAKMIWSLREKYKMGEPSAIQRIDELARKEGMSSGSELIERVESQMKNLVEAVSQMSINLNNSLVLLTQPFKNIANPLAPISQIGANITNYINNALSGLRQVSYDYHNLPTAQFLEKYPNFEKELALSYIVEDPMILKELDIPEVREFLGPIIYDQLILKNETISMEIKSNKSTRQKPEEPEKPIPPEPPRKGKPGSDLDEWLKWYHAMMKNGFKCTLREVAIKSGWSYGYVRQAHLRFVEDDDIDEN